MQCIIGCMSLRGWISVITLVLLGIVVYVAREEIVNAWRLLTEVDLAILWLLIPLQLIAYFAIGETVFEYLRSKKSIGHVPRWVLSRMSLEVNFVNHVLPSGGVSGISYMSWRLGHYGVSGGRAAAAQAVRYVVGFGAAIVIVGLSVLAITIDGNINRWMILVSMGIVLFMCLGTIGLVYVVRSKRRMEQFSRWLSSSVNKCVRRLTGGKKRVVLRDEDVLTFFIEMHSEYESLRKDRRILVKPFLWALVFTIAESSLFVVTFWALGESVNPAPIAIAYVLASIAGFIVVTPGGAGAYEAIMVTFLAIAGISSGVAIAGILLTRVVILFSTIVLGYAFYQHAIIRYGKDEPQIRR